MKTIMKNKIFTLFLCVAMLGSTSCVDDLLNRPSATELPTTLFWNNIDDAEKAMYGVYQGTRTFFNKSYLWDGHSDIMWARSATPTPSVGSSYGAHWNNGWTVVNRANYALFHIEQMFQKFPAENDQKQLLRIKSEIIFLRAIVYFRMIDLWKNIPYYTHILKDNNEAYSLTQTPISEIKDNILKDLDYAKDYLPPIVAEGERGRASRASAYGYMGKIKLYWACWKKNPVYPEDLNLTEAEQYYKAAAIDFAEVMKPVYGRKLYKDGAPGISISPFYYDLFDGRNEYSEEIIFATSNAGPNFGQGLGDTYIYDFGTRSTGAGGSNVTPNLRLVNRYQMINTGDYAPALIPNSNETLSGGACNPESYKGRDYRLFATVMWDGQKMLRLSDDGMKVGPDSMIFKYKQGDNVTYINAQAANSGYIFRKFVRQYAFGPREEGQQDTYLMRLPDLWLMYCEAVNEYNNGPTDECFELINKIRRRAALPDLDKTKFNSRDTFFKAIEQERIIELIAEGHRFFDIRRWKIAEEVWPQPNGFEYVNTWGEKQGANQFLNATDRDFLRYYIFQIPTGEITKNPRLQQNDCWL